MTETQKNASIDNIVEDQINWYSQKSTTAQKWYKGLKMTEIICAALIPFLVGFVDEYTYLQIVIGLLGVIIAVSAGISTLNKYQENWQTYRMTCESLKHERLLYTEKCKPYDTGDIRKTYVMRVQGLSSKENAQWSEYIVTKATSETEESS